MSEDKVIYKPNFELSEKDIEILVQSGVIPKGTPEAQIKLFAQICREKNLSPFSRQIHLVPRRDNKLNIVKYTIQIGIDGLRIIAERTGKYAGSDDYVYDEGLTIYEMLKQGRTKPTTATATVYKILPNSQVFPIKATAKWDEYYPGGSQAFMWDKMPFLMLGKTAEALALRKAFPEALSALYSDEEMQQAGEPIEIITPDTIETPKERKVTQEERKKLIELANHPIFENKKDENGVSYRVHILKLANSKELTFEKWQEAINKCENLIKGSFEELEKKQKQAFSLLKNADEKVISKIVDMPFPDESDIWNFILEQSEEKLEQIIQQLQNKE